jgi:hypothetical protein
MKTYSQQIKERQDYTGFLAKTFYKDLMAELERLEDIEQAYNELNAEEPEYEETY